MYWYGGRGDMYQGAWHAGRRHGPGSQHCAALEAQYIGDWCAPSMHSSFVRAYMHVHSMCAYICWAMHVQNSSRAVAALLNTRASFLAEPVAVWMACRLA